MSVTISQDDIIYLVITDRFWRPKSNPIHSRFLDSWSPHRVEPLSSGGPAGGCGDVLAANAGLG